jgi:hypothetical protein
LLKTFSEETSDGWEKNTMKEINTKKIKSKVTTPIKNVLCVFFGDMNTTAILVRVSFYL